MDDETDDVLYGNDLPQFASATFIVLATALWPRAVQVAVSRSGCDVEDHNRGLRYWAIVGGKTIYLPAKSEDPHKVDYDAIRDITRTGVEAQIRENVAVLGEVIFERLGRVASA